jgi:hypothetical protein
MPLAKEIETLINDIGGGLTESSIRNRLSVIQEHAEALDIALEKGDAALTECNSALHDACADLERLKADAETKKIPSKENGLEEITEKLLRLFARPGRSAPSVEQASRELGIEQFEAEHHADILIEKEMIEVVAYAPAKGTIYALTPKGRAYLVKNKPE